MHPYGGAFSYIKKGTDMICMYNEDGAHYFEDGAEIPKGFVDCPTKVEGNSTDELEELKAKCDELGIKYHHKAGVAKLKELLEG